MSSEDVPCLLELAYRADLDILVGRWSGQPAAHEMAPVYQHLQAEALQAHTRFWLLDIRRRTLNDQQFSQWLLHNFFPGMAQRLGGRVYVAYLVGPTLHEAIVKHPNYVPAEAYDDKPFATSFFGDERAAINWLQIQQTDKVAH